MKTSRFLFSSVLFMTACGFFAGCAGKESDDKLAPARPAALVETQEAETRTLTRRAVYTGSIQPTRVARVASPAEGPVIQCAVREGDKLAKGQQLIRIGRNRMAEAGLAAAREELQRITADFNRIEKLVDDGALPAEQLEIARAALKSAEARTAAAETGATDHDIRAPWDGVVAKMFTAEGDYVVPRAHLLELYDPNSLRVRFTVPERDILHIKPGMEAEVALDAWPKHIFKVRVERIYPQLDAATRTVTVEATLETDKTLINGLFARVKIPVEIIENAVSVPDEAIMALPDGTLAVFAVEDGKAFRRAVKTGLEAEGYIQIMEGVAKGDQIVVRGQERLSDGAAIRRPGTGKRPASPEDKTLKP